MEHCETTALGVLARDQGLDLSEAMLFGLGSGLGFVYWDSKAMGFPFLGGRVKPFELTKNFAAQLGLKLDVRETTSAAQAWRNIAGPLDAGAPVGLQLDSYHLEYFSSRIHFAGHIVAMYGYDAQSAYLVDTDQQGGTVATSLSSLATARAERGPMAAKNRSFTLSVPPEGPPLRDSVVSAITSCAAAFLDPPIANLGYRGIAKTARQIGSWMHRSPDPREDLARTALLMEQGGTGGALFRNLYRDFLAECTQLIDDAHLRTGQTLYAEAAALWSRVAACLSKAAETGEAGELTEASNILSELSRIEYEAMDALSRISSAN